jgi:cytochrome c-type biogenesis protein CcmH
MTLLVLAFVVLAVAVVAILCLPLVRGVPVVADRGYFDRVVYRDQLKEVDRDLARGVLNAAEADAARLEIQRRLLAVQVGPPSATTWSGRSPYLTGIVAVCVIAGAASLYWRFGAPSLPDAPFVAQIVQRSATPPDTQHLEMLQAASRLEQKLLADPSNADGWALYARTESMLGDFKKASAAYRHAIDLGVKTSDVFAGYGEMLVLTTDGIVSPAAQQAFTSALAVDPKNDVARYYLALADGQAGDEKQAIDKWLALAAELPSDTPMRQSIARGIAEAAKAGSIEAPPLPAGTAPQSGPNADQIAAAAQMPEGERKEMIRGMVAQLAARVQAEPGNLDGWMQLGRSYAVLGETDKSADAFEHAAKLKPDDVSIKLQAFQALITSWQPEQQLPPSAVTLLRQVAAQAPEQPEVLWYLGIDAAHNGHGDEARTYWTKLIDALPAGGADAKMVKDALDSLPAK